MAGLAGYQKRQSEVAVRRSNLVAEYNAWLKGFCESNDEAKALVLKQAVTNSPSFKADLEKLVEADPEGAALVARRDAIDAEIGELQGEIKAYIGARMRRQVAEHGGEETAAARKYMAEHGSSMPLPTNAATASPQIIDNR